MVEKQTNTLIRKSEIPFTKLMDLGNFDDCVYFEKTCNLIIYCQDL